MSNTSGVGAGRPEAIRSWLWRKIAEVEADWPGWVDLPPTEKQLKYVRSLLCKAVPDEDKRHRVLMYLVGKPSTTDLLRSEASALIDWLRGPDGGLKGTAASELAACLAAALKEAGQLELPMEEAE